MTTLIAQKVDLDTIKPGPLPFSAEGAAGGIENLISTIVGFLPVVSGLAFIVYFILAGFNWITSGGEPEKVKKAQANITNALVGLIIVVIAYAVTSVIGAILGFSILNPADILNRISPGAPKSTSTQEEIKALELFFGQ